MIAERLSKTVVERIAAAEQDTVVWDETLPGFGVRVKPSGVRSYIVQYRNRSTGASKRLTIGRHGPLLTFDQAKKRARVLLADAMRGEDPAEARKVARKAPSVADLAPIIWSAMRSQRNAPRAFAMIARCSTPLSCQNSVEEGELGRPSRHRGHSRHDERPTLPGKSGPFSLVQDVQPCRGVGMAIG
jgi:hypothetical protein